MEATLSRKDAPGSSVEIAARQYCTDRAMMLVRSVSPGARHFEDFAAFSALFGAHVEPGAILDVALPGPVTQRVGRMLSPLTAEAADER